MAQRKDNQTRDMFFQHEDDGCNFISLMPVSVDLDNSKLCATLAYSLWKLASNILLLETGNYTSLSARFLDVADQGRLELVLNGNVLVNKGIITAYSYNDVNLDCLFPDTSSFDCSNYEAEINKIFNEVKLIGKNSYDYVLTNVSINSCNIDFLSGFHSIILLSHANEIGIRYLNKEIIRILKINPDINISVILISKNNQEHFYHWDVLRDTVKDHMYKDIFLIGLINAEENGTWELTVENQKVINSISKMIHKTT